MSRGALHILQRQGRYGKRTKVELCTSSKKGSESRSSRFEPRISLISFSRGSGPPLIKQSNTHTWQLGVVTKRGSHNPFNFQTHVQKKCWKTTNTCDGSWRNWRLAVGRHNNNQKKYWHVEWPWSWCTLVGPQEEQRGPSGYTPRGYSSSPGREAK